MLLTKPENYSFGVRPQRVPAYRPLLKHEKIAPDDVVEDLASGKRVKVRGSFYGFLVGQAAGQARQLPDVFDVVRP